MTTIQDQIRAQTDAFADQIAELIRKAALEAVQNALSTAPAVVAPVKKGAPAKRAAAPKAAPVKKAAPAKAPKAAPAKKAVKAAAPKAGGKRAAPAKRPPGAKRPPAELAALVERLASHIKSNPGQGVEAIGKALNTPTKDLTLPIKKLVGSKRIRFEGVKRATKYFPA